MINSFPIQKSAIPSVFISSTVKEFRDLRSTLSYILREKGVKVYLSEDLDFDIKGDRSACEECFENIRSCDYYVLIIGSSTGSIYDYHEGCSITRQEYRIAKEHFLKTHHPRMLLFIKQSTLDALESKDTNNDEDIDNHDHLESFIAEVENPDEEGVPSYLARYKSFEDIIGSLTVKLNAGRSVSETISRYTLLSELSSNLSAILMRHGTYASLPHQTISKVRDDRLISTKNMNEYTRLTKDEITRLALGIFPRRQRSDFRTNCIEECIDKGVFLKINPITANLEETSMHKTLKQTLDDINRLSTLDTSDCNDSWTSVMMTIRESNEKQLRSAYFKNIDLMYVFSYFDRIEDIFNEHVFMCKYLLGQEDEIQHTPRRPISPFHDMSDSRFLSERVSASEVVYLIQKNVWPFGSNIPRELYGKTRDEQIEKMLSVMINIVKEQGVEPDKDDLEIFRKVAENHLDSTTIPPEDGLKEIG